MVGGRDVSDVPLTVAGDDISGLVVTLTDHASVLTGTVRDAQNAADVAATVLVFPTDRALWLDYGGLPRRLRTARTDRTGGFPPFRRCQRVSTTRSPFRRRTRSTGSDKPS